MGAAATVIWMNVFVYEVVGERVGVEVEVDLVSGERVPSGE